MAEFLKPRYAIRFFLTIESSASDLNLCKEMFGLATHLSVGALHELSLRVDVHLAYEQVSHLVDVIDDLLARSVSLLHLILLEEHLESDVFDSLSIHALNFTD